VKARLLSGSCNGSEGKRTGRLDLGKNDYSPTSLSHIVTPIGADIVCNVRIMRKGQGQYRYTYNANEPEKRTSNHYLIHHFIFRHRKDSKVDSQISHLQ
jgi:hypothetical protein